MSKLGAVFLISLTLAATPLAAAPVSADQMAAVDVPHHIARDAAWGCRDKHDVFDLLFLGLSTSFDSKFVQALGDGRCDYFTPGEDVTILEDGGHGLVKVQLQRGAAEPVVYWTPLRNVK